MNRAKSDPDFAAAKLGSGHPPPDSNPLSSRLRLASPVRDQMSMLPPPPFDDVSALGLSWWRDARISIDTGLLCLDQTIKPGDRLVRALTPALGAVRDAFDDRNFDAELVPYAHELHSVVEEVLLHVLDPQRRSDMGTYWLLAERLAVLPPIQGEDLGRCARMLDCAIATFIRALRTLASTVPSTPPRSFEDRPTEREMRAAVRAQTRSTVRPTSQGKMQVAKKVGSDEE
jgi:hypothetical protein